MDDATIGWCTTPPSMRAEVARRACAAMIADDRPRPGAITVHLETHVTRVLRKLGLESRLQVGLYVRDHTGAGSRS